MKRLFIAVAALAFPSCVVESAEDCLNVRLLIKTDHDNGRWAASTRARTRNSAIEEWYEGIDSIDVYVFDENEKFVTLWEGGPYVAGEEYEVPLREIGLPEGVYTFVAWTDSGNHYVSNLDQLMAGATGAAGAPEPGFSLGDMRMHINLDELTAATGALENDLHHRHHGILPRAYVSNNSISYPKPATIELSPSMHKVNFTVVGVTTYTLDERDAFTLSVIDSNSAHTFLNACDPALGRAYRHRRGLKAVPAAGPTRAIDQDTELCASMLLLQLDDDTVTGVEIHDSRFPDQPIHVEENLAGLIRAAYSTDSRTVSDEFFDEVLEYDVKIDLRAYPKITLTVNGWIYIYIADRIRPLS